MRWLVAGLLTLALVVAGGAWFLHRGGGGVDPAARARTLTPVQRSAAAASSAAASSASSHAEARAAAVKALPNQLDTLLGGGGDTWSLAALDLTSGSSLSLGATSGMYTGSIVKVTLLENLLRVEGGAAELTDAEQDSASSMITESDNDAALDVWNDAGGDDTLDETVQLLGLTDTQIAPDGYFGVSTTSATDQIKVLQQLVAPTFLTVDDAAYIRGLMGQVEDDQRWGAPTIADPGTPTQNKNGWLNNDADDELWLVNTLGIVTIGGDQYLVAVLTQHQPDYDSGVATLNQACADLAAALR